MIPTDEDLMVLYQKDDFQAVEMLYKRHSPKVFGYFRSRLRLDPASAEDLLQKCFLKLHVSRHGFDPKLKFEPWLFVIAKTTLWDHLRKTSSQNEELLAPEELENIGSSAPTDPVSFEDYLQSLPEKDRELVRLRVLDELSYQEIAVRLKKTETSLRKSMSRALRKIQDSLKKRSANDVG